MDNKNILSFSWGEGFDFRETPAEAYNYFIIWSNIFLK